MDLSACDDYESEKDWIYLNCSQEDQCSKLKDLHTAWRFGLSPMIIVIIVLSIFALIFNLIYTVLIHIIWVREKFKGHKRHVFIANRSVTTILTLTILYTTLILWQTTGFNYVTTSILLVIAACDYMTLASNFFIVTNLMYVAVNFPIFYSQKLRFRHCIMIGWGFSTLAILMGVIIGLSGSALFFPSESFFTCPIDSCQLPFAIAILSLICLGYLLMTICYAVVFLRLRNQVLCSLRFSFLVVSMAFLPAIIFFIVFMVNFDTFAGLGDASSIPCSRLEKSSVMLMCCYFVSAAVIFWLIGATVDPIFNTITEAKFCEHFATFRRLRSIFSRQRPTSV